MTPNPSVNRTACKLCLQVPFGLRRPVTSNIELPLILARYYRLGSPPIIHPNSQIA